MLEGKPVHAIVPARGGSKGISGKNLYRLGKDTLLERAIKLGRKCRHVDNVLVSTDDPEMFRIARQYGAATPTLRPAHLATDDALTVDVVLHVMRECGIDDGYVLLLQTTTPLRTLADLDGLFEAYATRGSEADAIVSLTRHFDPHPDKIQTIVEGYVRSYLGKAAGAPRQSLPAVYRFNGAFYLVRCGAVSAQHTLLPERTLPYLMPPERSVNLDHPLDLLLLEAMVERGIATVEDH
jgi:CMP-N-acetylneuraminic acid synthetase